MLITKRFKVVVTKILEELTGGNNAPLLPGGLDEGNGGSGLRDGGEIVETEEKSSLNIVSRFKIAVKKAWAIINNEPGPEPNIELNETDIPKYPTVTKRFVAAVKKVATEDGYISDNGGDGPIIVFPEPGDNPVNDF